MMSAVESTALLRQYDGRRRLDYDAGWSVAQQKRVAKDAGERWAYLAVVEYADGARIMIEFLAYEHSVGDAIQICFELDIEEGQCADLIVEYAAYQRDMLRHLKGRFDGE